MVKQEKHKWKPVKLEGSIFSGNIDGLVGIEELSDYNLDAVLSSSQKRGKKRTSSETIETEPKKVKTNERKTAKSKKQKSKTTSEPGAFVRNPNFVAQVKVEQNKKAKKSKQAVQVKDQTLKKSAKKQKVEIGETRASETSGEKYTVDDLKAWCLAPLPDELLQGLADLGFTKPTPIQELTLPPAILGRRDILGAAETGSGKTLAFGLPILTGILKLKEEAKNEQSLNDDENEDKMNDEDKSSDVESADDEPEENSEDENDEPQVNSEDENDEPDSDQSDFEEREENVEDLNINGIGCVKSIDNVQMDEFASFSRKPVKPLYALILTPTRELAIQIKNHLIAVAKHTDIKVAVILGGMASVKQERILNKGPEIVVATPGRLWELIQEGNPHLSQVDNIKYLAIDETDRMIEKFHFQELHHLLERINMDEVKRKKRQNFVFSATLTLVHDLPRHLAKKKQLKYRNSSKITKMTPEQKLKQIIEMLGIHNPKVVDVTQASGTAKSLTECRINCALEEKDYYVYYFLQRHPGRTLIFCNSIGCVKRLATLLGMLGCTALPLHACMQQRQRLKNLERFRDDPYGILVATDVAARGLDIPKVEHVLHYQTPRTSESYVHRSGRTARASEEGITVLLIEPNELNDYVKLCRTLGRTQDLPSFPIFENLLTAVKQRVNLARKLDKLELQTKRTTSETGWLQKAAKDMDIIIDEDDFSLAINDKDELSSAKRQINITRKELASLLRKPIFPKGFSVNYPTSNEHLNINLVQGDQSTEKAVDVMKSQIEKSSKEKGNKTRKVFKNNISPKKEIDKSGSNVGKKNKGHDNKKRRKGVK